MDERAVVTCFLRNDGEILLCRRSDAVGSYQGQWGGVAGHVRDDAGEWRDPEAAARAEIAEETGLGNAVTVVRSGEPFRVDDGQRWLVHPFLFDCDSRAVEPNEETADWEWCHPPEILRRETVPPGERERVERAKRNLRRERIERVERIENDAVSYAEGRDLVDSIVGIDRALNALDQLGSVDLEAESQRQTAADRKRWLNFLTKALGRDEGRSRNSR